MKPKLWLTVLAALISMFFFSCKDKTTTPADVFPFAINPHTVVLPVLVADQCTSVPGQNEIIILPDVALTQELVVGSIIVAEPTIAFPNGFLRKITQLTPGEGNIVAVTETTSLTDAIDSGALDITKTLTPADLQSKKSAMPGVKLSSEGTDLFHFDINSVLWDEDGNVNTTNDQATLSGTADIGLTLEGKIRIRDGELHTMSFVAKENIELNATVSNDGSFFGLNQDVVIFSQPFQPTVLNIGTIPVVITPVLEVKLNLAGNATASVSVTYNYTNTVTAGVEYVNSAWNPVHTITEQASSDNADPTAYNISYKASLVPNMSVLFYGLLGPSASLSTFGEIIVNPAAADWWGLWAGVTSQVAVNPTIFSTELAQPEPWQVLNTRFLVQKNTTPIQGTLTGRVNDAVSNLGIAGVTVNVYSNGAKDLVGTALTDASGEYNFVVNAGTGYRVNFIKTGYHEVTYNNVNVPGNQETNLQTILQIDESYVGVGTVSGVIRNALTAVVESDVSLNFRLNWNNLSGAVSGSATTDIDGAYTISSLVTGNYCVEAFKTDFVTTYFNIVVLGGITTPGQNGVITPNLASDEIRIVLTWGSSPSDLDSHITGPRPDDGRFHVYYSNRNFDYDGLTYCNLDVDDTSSYGPETVTIYNQTDGLYRYSIHDYSNRYSDTSTIMSNSGATVRVYFGSTLAQTFYVPTNTIGTLWTVFELYGNQIVPKNLMTNQSSPGDITKNAKTDAGLMQNLPPKKHK